ncbi:hypothetical protein F9L07_15335 [Pimelobacter simplex]|uniref:Uncharacterized protein n=1 Tax=Nocardioides simplex TaxID=2045 RepID=A0A7J5E4D6_NOCSI|nr:hypothetical protein [Pimelobacter simplex]KAB2813065.1 hypothetical protein F9L07_15335 [Pimelobacter simplex]
MSPDLTDQIVTAFEAGYAGEPAPRPTGAYVALGRRRQRHRRLGLGAAAVSAVGVLAVGAGLLVGGGGPDAAPDRAPVAGTPSATATATATATGSAPAPPSQRISELLSPGQHAGYDAAGRVVLRPGWRIEREVANPLRRTAPEASVGLVVVKGTQRYWYLLDHTRTGGGASWDPAGTTYARFEQWLDDQVDLQNGDQPVDLVTFAGAGPVLEPGIGARILRQWPDPDVPGFAAPGDTTAVAKVEVDGLTYFVLARRSADGATDTIPYQADLLAEPTLAAFLAHARDRYASGEGLR